LYYYNNDKLEKSVFLHYRILGSKKLLSFLNEIDGIVEIDESSFDILGIKKVDNSFVRHL
jgi:hypothetical protein